METIAGDTEMFDQQALLGDSLSDGWGSKGEFTVPFVLVQEYLGARVWGTGIDGIFDLLGGESEQITGGFECE